MPRKIASEKTSKYYGVCKNNPRKNGSKGRISQSEKYKFRAEIKRNGTVVMSKLFIEEREAAIAVDMQLIAMGEEPRNILKRKP